VRNAVPSSSLIAGISAVVINITRAYARADPDIFIASFARDQKRGSGSALAGNALSARYFLILPLMNIQKNPVQEGKKCW
jgi:hypothetical protein